MVARLASLASLVVLAACATAPRPVVAVISADAEWRALAPKLRDARPEHTPYGDAVVRAIGGRDVIFFHGGYGKVSAAGSTQYAVDRWHPALIVNLGTCGGFGGARRVGDVVLAAQRACRSRVARP